MDFCVKYFVFCIEYFGPLYCKIDQFMYDQFLQTNYCETLIKYFFFTIFLT